MILCALLLRREMSFYVFVYEKFHLYVVGTFYVLFFLLYLFPPAIQLCSLYYIWSNLSLFFITNSPAFAPSTLSEPHIAPGTPSLLLYHCFCTTGLSCCRLGVLLILTFHSTEECDASADPFPALNSIISLYRFTRQQTSDHTEEHQ